MGVALVLSAGAENPRSNRLQSNSRVIVNRIIIDFFQILKGFRLFTHFLFFQSHQKGGWNKVKQGVALEKQGSFG